MSQLGKKKILVLTSTFPRFRGDPTPDFVYQLSKRLTRKYDVVVLCPHAKGAKTFEELDGLVIYRYRYLPFNMGTLAYEGGITPKLRKKKGYYVQVPFFLISQFISLYRVVKRERADLIHAHWILPQGLVAVLYSLFFKRSIRVLLTVHGADIFAYDGRIGKIVKKFVCEKVDGITVVSNAIKKKLLDLGIEKKDIHVYPMGVNTEMFNPDKSTEEIRVELGIDGHFLLFVGRLVEKKGLEYLLQSMPDIVKMHPRTKLVIIGDGVIKHDMIELSRELGMSDHVLFLGAMPHIDLPPYFATADLFVGPSVTAGHGDTEGFGLVFAEALSSGTIVVTSDLPAISDIVIQKETGFVVPERSSADLACTVNDILDAFSGNAEGLHEMKRNAMRHVRENFDWVIVGQNYVVVIKSLIENK